MPGPMALARSNCAPNFWYGTTGLRQRLDPYELAANCGRRRDREMAAVIDYPTALTVSIRQEQRHPLLWIHCFFAPTLHAKLSGLPAPHSSEFCTHAGYG